MNDDFPARKPDFNLSVKRRTSTDRGKIGAGWMNPDGTISIRLNPCVVISHADDVTILLFPASAGSTKNTDK